MNERPDREKLSSEVFRAREEIVLVGPADLDFLKERVREARRHRVRLCAHRTPEDALHEMFILLEAHTYIRPHRHPGKAESLLVLEGEADAVFFDEAGAVTGRVHLGDLASGLTFYYRIAAPVYHTLIISTPHLLFHEATSGPFRPEETIFAAWAPAQDDEPAIRRWLAELNSGTPY